MNTILTTKYPFSFHSVIHSHGWMQLTPFRYDEPAETMHYVTQLSGGRTVAIAMSGQPNGVTLTAADNLTEDELRELISQVRWILGMDVDLSGFFAAVEGRSEFARTRELCRGRILRSATLFEDVIKTVLTTNTLWAATHRMNNKIIEQFGRPLDEDPTRHAFPTAEVLAASTEEVLRQETRLGYRAPYVLSTAQSVASGEVNLEELKKSDLPTAELRKELLKLKGVGGYAAANLLLILGRGDYLPIDTWAMHMVSHEWYNGEPVTAKQVEEAFAEWGQWKGLAYYFREWDHRKENNNEETNA